MHAILVGVTIEPGHADEATAQLENNIVPMVKQSPGAVSGYWMRSDDGSNGFSVVLYRDEQSARAGAEMEPNSPRPEFVKIDSVEVREVVAQF